MAPLYLQDDVAQLNEPLESLLPSPELAPEITAVPTTGGNKFSELMYLPVALFVLFSFYIFFSWRISRAPRNPFQNVEFLEPPSDEEDDSDASSLSSTVNGENNAEDENDDDYNQEDIVNAVHAEEERTRPRLHRGHLTVQGVEMVLYAPTTRAIRRAKKARLLMNKLETKKLEINEDDEDARCPICLESLAEEPATQGACKHAIHVSCLRTWILKDRAVSCPVCRVKMRLPPDETEEEGKTIVMEESDSKNQIGMDDNSIIEMEEGVTQGSINSSIAGPSVSIPQDQPEFETSTVNCSSSTEIIASKNSVDSKVEPGKIANNVSSSTQDKIK